MLRHSRPVRRLAFASLVLVALTLTACGDDSGGAATTVTRSDSIVDTTTVAPVGYPLPKGDIVTLPDNPPRFSEFDLHVGDVFSVAEWPGAPAPGPGSHIARVETKDGQIWYQAVSAGEETIVLQINNHPGGCDQPGKDCADAIPSPELILVITAPSSPGDGDAGGYPLTKGATLDVPSGRYGSTAVAAKIGDVFSLPDEDWAPTPLPGAIYVLAEVVDGQRWYQAVAAGTVSFPVGPVGHPSGCTPTPSKPCPPDATPPPMVELTVTA